LHLDIWHKGENILFDAGSYKYNTDPATLKYFAGTASHNSVMLNGYDQMEKGSRFIWYHWSQAVRAEVTEQNEYYNFEGVISAFRHVNSKIKHRRVIRKLKGELVWEIEDHVDYKPTNIPMIQYWHVEDGIAIQSTDGKGKPLTPIEEIG